MLSCREVSRMISDGSADEAGFLRRLSIRFHLLMCVHCRRFRSQIEALGRAAREHAREAAGAALPDGMERRIVDRLASGGDGK